MAQCITCGFLAIKNHLTETCELGMRARETGVMSVFPLPAGGSSTSEPFCYAGSPSFQRIANFSNPIAVQPVLARDHACEKWRQWRVGKSPKEHEEMIAIEGIQAQQRTAEETAERLRQEERQRIDAQRKDDLSRAEQIRKEDVARTEKHAARNFWISVVAISISALTAAWNIYQGATKKPESSPTPAVSQPNNTLRPSATHN
jgi:hypothetical protein